MNNLYLIELYIPVNHQSGTMFSSCKCSACGGTGIQKVMGPCNRCVDDTVYREGFNMDPIKCRFCYGAGKCKNINVLCSTCGGGGRRLLEEKK